MRRYPQFDRKIVDLDEHGFKYIKRIAIDRFTLPNGDIGQWESINNNASTGVSIIPITDEGKIVLIELFRFPIDDWIIELPGGESEGEDDLFETAKRELREETGYEARSIDLVGGNRSDGWFYSGKANTRAVFFTAFGCKKVKEPILDPVEKYTGLEVIEKSPAEIMNEIAIGEITYNLSVSHALLILLGRRLARGL